MEEAAVQRDAVPERARRAEAVRREAATRRSSASGRGRRSKSTASYQDSPAKARRPCCQPSRWRRSACGSCPIRIRKRSATCSKPTCKKISAEDRRSEDDAHARRQAVDDRVRQQVRPRRRARHREGIRQGAGLQSRRRLDSSCLDVSGGARVAERSLRRRPARRERPRAEREARSRRTSTTASLRRRICTDEIANLE